MDVWAYPPYVPGDKGSGQAILEYGGPSPLDSGTDYSPGLQREPVKTALMHRRAIVPFTLAPVMADGWNPMIGRHWGFAEQLKPITPLQRITIIYEQYDMQANQSPYALEPVIGPVPPYWCAPEGLG